MIYWYKGDFGENTIELSLEGKAFRFGTGVFESIYYNGSESCHLDNHLLRLCSALSDLDLPHEPLDLGVVDEIVLAVIRRNGLEGQPARVNIYCFLDGDTVEPLVTARPHEPVKGQTFRLQVCQEHHVSALCGHKTMNFMFYDRALARAKTAGFDGAVLLDLGDNLLETNSSALVFMKDSVLITPKTEYKLPSTALVAASDVLNIKEQIIPLADLKTFGHAYQLNSILGMRPVVSIGEVTFEPDEETSRRATKAILCEG